MKQFRITFINKKHTPWMNMDNFSIDSIEKITNNYCKKFNCNKYEIEYKNHN